ERRALSSAFISPALSLLLTPVFSLSVFLLLTYYHSISIALSLISTLHRIGHFSFIFIFSLSLSLSFFLSPLVTAHVSSPSRRPTELYISSIHFPRSLVDVSPSSYCPLFFYFFFLSLSLSLILFV